jgi:hypothetical protein
MKYKADAIDFSMLKELNRIRPGDVTGNDSAIQQPQFDAAALKDFVPGLYFFCSVEFVA